MKNHFSSIFRIGLTPLILFSFILSLFGTPQTVYAAGLDVQPLTWNIIGLDSNKPMTGPNHFPVGVRVCNNSGEAISDVKATLNWESVNPYIDFRPGTSNTVTMFSLPDAPLAAGACADFYFEVEVEQTTAAYDTTRRYHVDVTAVDAATRSTNYYSGSTQTPRELYVEHLVSQSRNAVTDVQYGTEVTNLKSVPAGGTMALVAGQTYFIKLVGFTATQGYNQLESFINFPNTIFQVLSVSSEYSAPSLGYTIDKMYSDACGWDNILSSPTYRSCIVSDNKTGGDISVLYKVKILKVPDGGTDPVVNPEPLSTLIYDFSGSSFHYNADFGISARYAYVLDATAIDISKSFFPATVAPGATSTLTFTLTNSAPVTVAGISFIDNLPDITPADTTTGQMVAEPTTSSTSGCGVASGMNFASGDTSLTFSGGTIAPNGTCTISVSVRVPEDPTSGNYLNISENVKIGDLDSGHYAEDTLTIDANATLPGSGICGVQMAYWNMGTTNAVVPPAPVASLGANVDSASARFVPFGTATSSIVSTNPDYLSGSSGSGSWESEGYPKSSAPTFSTASYYEFSVVSNSKSYKNITLQLDEYGSSSFVGGNILFVWSSTDGINWNPIVLSTSDPISASTWTRSSPYPASATGANTITYFRVSAEGANNASTKFNLDDVRITGCGNPIQPNLVKTFSPNPVVVGGASTLTFTVTNTNSVNLTGAKFTDTLPTGLEYDMASSPSTSCGGSPSMTITDGSSNPGNTTFNFGQTAGATIPPGGCTVSVGVIATTEGPHQNVSDFIYTNEGGTNSDPSGSAKASLVAVLPPTIDKNFSPNMILANETSTLTFIMTNPNPSDTLPNVAFTDIFPTTPGNMVTASTPSVTTIGCGFPTIEAPIGGGSVVGGAASIGFSGGTIAGEKPVRLLWMLRQLLLATTIIRVEPLRQPLAGLPKVRKLLKLL